MARLAILLAILGGCGGFYPAPDWPTTAEKTELLSACFVDVFQNGRAVAVRDAFCGIQTPELIEWGSLPITVHSTGSYANETIATIEIWNEWMGFTLFTYTPEPEGADVEIHDGGARSFYNGLTTWSKNGDRLHVDITMYIHSHETLAHELGHAVGLAHDPDNKRSLMHPYSTPRYLPELESIDVKLLRRKYTHL